MSNSLKSARDTGYERCRIYRYTGTAAAVADSYTGTAVKGTRQGVRHFLTHSRTKQVLWHHPTSKPGISRSVGVGVCLAHPRALVLTSAILVEGVPGRSRERESELSSLAIYVILVFEKKWRFRMKPSILHTAVFQELCFCKQRISRLRLFQEVARMTAVSGRYHTYVCTGRVVEDMIHTTSSEYK